TSIQGVRPGYRISLTVQGVRAGYRLARTVWSHPTSFPGSSTVYQLWHRLPAGYPNAESSSAHCPHATTPALPPVPRWLPWIGVWLDTPAPLAPDRGSRDGSDRTGVLKA